MARNNDSAKRHSRSQREPEPETGIETEVENVEKLPVPTRRAGPPASLINKMKADAGKGVSTDAADNLVPLIYLLQTNSPQCNRQHEKYIKGAEAGDIWLRNAPPGFEIVKCEEGLEFQPVHFSKEWVEWQPNRGGFVGRHGENRPDVAENVEVRGDDGKTRRRWQMPNGNIVVETRYHVGYAIVKGRALPYTIPLSSTGHTVSKQWMVQMNSEIVIDEHGNAVRDDETDEPLTMASWGAIYRLMPKLQRRDSHSWLQYEVELERYVETETEYDRGARLYQAFDTGEKKVAEETEDAEFVAGGAAASPEFDETAAGEEV